MKTLVALFFAVLFLEVRAEGSLFDKLTSGFKLAGQLLGIDHVSQISQLISNAFSPHQRKEDNINEDENIFSGFLRIFGFDSKKIAAIGINGMIFMAQLISTSLTNTPASEIRHDVNDDVDPLTLISSASGVQHILEHSKNSDLPQFLIDSIKERSLDEDTGCIQLLICKLSPFVKKMQTYLKNPQKHSGGKSVLFKHLPSVEEMEDNAELCEDLHPYCRVVY